jgi:hypothetical protein
MFFVDALRVLEGEMKGVTRDESRQLQGRRLSSSRVRCKKKREEGWAKLS